LALTAIVLAGGAPDAVAALAPDAPNKAFVPIAGRTLVARTIDALRAAASVGQIVAVAPADAFGNPALADADALRVSGERIKDSLAAGVAGLPSDELLLICASDLPVLTARAVDDFVERAVGAGADLVYGCVERRNHLARFPAVPHTWAHMRDGVYCGAGLVAMRPRALDSLERFLDRLGAARKNPLRLASIFGWNALARYAVGRLSIERAERRASALLGVRVRTAICAWPEAAVNVDRVGDVALAEALVAEGGATTSA
jgi:molybdopterin-guanine dinucleotide biosynthesis protein A